MKLQSIESFLFENQSSDPWYRDPWHDINSRIINMRFRPSCIIRELSDVHFNYSTQLWMGDFFTGKYNINRNAYCIFFEKECDAILFKFTLDI